jgi:hypothetical protein
LPANRYRNDDVKISSNKRIVPLAPGPPSNQASTPIRRAGSRAGSRATDKATVSELVSSGSSGTRNDPHWSAVLPQACHSIPGDGAIAGHVVAVVGVVDVRASSSPGGDAVAIDVVAVGGPVSSAVVHAVITIAASNIDSARRERRTVLPAVVTGITVSVRRR